MQEKQEVRTQQKLNRGCKWLFSTFRTSDRIKEGQGDDEILGEVRYNSMGKTLRQREKLKIQERVAGPESVAAAQYWARDLGQEHQL